MSKGLSHLASSLKQLGEIQVSEWDFKSLLNKNLGEIEIAHSLRKLGNIRVMEWDFRNTLPAVNRLAKQEVDLMGLVRRASRYKVMDWDFRSAPPAGGKSAPRRQLPEPEEMQALIIRLKDFLQYVVVNLIDEPNHARIKVRVIGPNVVRFKIVLVKRDVAMLIGRQGHTASAIRGVLKAAAGLSGVHALLLIHSHEDEQ